MAQAERMKKSQSCAEAHFQEYVEELLNHICYDCGFGISFATPDSIRNNWHMRIKMDKATKKNILDHARAFIAMTPLDLAQRKNFLESLARRIAEYLVPYMMRDPRNKNAEVTMTYLKNELYDKCNRVQGCVRRAKANRQKSIDGHKHAQEQHAAKLAAKAEKEKAKKEAAEKALAATKQMRAKIVVVNGKRYVKTAY